MLAFYRSFKKNKWTLFITILGFAAGLTAALLLLIFIEHELSFDRHWKDADRIFRINTLFTENNNTIEYPICPREAFTDLPDKVPGINAVVQIYRTHNPEIKFENHRFRNLKFFYVDSTFHRVFQIKTLHGDLQQALNNPDAVVINQRTAEKLFGNKNPTNQMITVNEYSLPEKEQLFQVGAVVQNLPQTSHFDFDVLLPMTANQHLSRMGGLEFYTYLLINKNVPLQPVIKKINDEYNAIMLDWWGQGSSNSKPPLARLIPLKEIYLHSNTRYEPGQNGDLKTIRILMMLTVLILGIAVANFINLFLVQSARRSLETGIRKTLGATRFSLIRQFMKESFLITSFAFLVAVELVSLLIVPFGNLVRRQLQIDVLFRPGPVLGIIALVMALGLLAGAYPAWYLSKFNPIQVLKGSGTTIKLKHRLRKGIVLCQFAICMLLLTNLFVLQKQFNYMNNKPLGFDAKKVIAYEGLSPQIQNKFTLIKNELKQFADIVAVTGSHSRPGSGASGQYINRFGATSESRITIREVRIQPEYLETYGMQLNAGRSFDANRTADRQAVILNETAVQELGLTEPVGAQVDMFRKPFEVIGVVKDYHYASLRTRIKPEVFTFYRDQIFTISIKISTANTPATLARIAGVFQNFDPEYTPDYVFVQEAFEAMYSGEHRMIKLVQAGSLLALLLTILGLASITAITVKQRTKEIGIRKVIGATNTEIIQSLVGSQMKILVVTTSIAGVGAFWLVQKWLENYAYRTSLDFWIFAGAGAIVLLIALTVTAVISYRASNTNPVEALRYE